MLLDVRNALKNPGQSYPVACDAELPPMDVLDERITFGPVHLKGGFVGSGESVKLTGQVSAVVHAHCAKCLEPVETKLKAHISEVYTKRPNPDDPDQRPLDGYEIELLDVIKDAVVLELPMRFLCSRDCLGLCPTCGTNRNTQRCVCQKGDMEKHPFTALSELLTEESKEV